MQSKHRNQKALTAFALFVLYAALILPRLNGVTSRLFEHQIEKQGANAIVPARHENKTPLSNWSLRDGTNAANSHQNNETPTTCSFPYGRHDFATRHLVAGRRNETPGNSLVFLHMTHTGGSALREVLARLCESRQHLQCWETTRGELPRDLSDHSLDILYGHFEFDVPEVHRLMKPAPIVFSILREPFEVIRSNFFYRHSGARRYGGPVNFLTKKRDFITPRLIGVKKTVAEFNFSNAGDPECRKLASHLSAISLIGMHYDYDTALVLLHDLLPTSWNVSMGELCARKINAITVGNGRWQSQFAKNISCAARRQFYDNWRCAHAAYEYASTTWDRLLRLEHRRRVDDFRQVCASKNETRE